MTSACRLFWKSGAKVLQKKGTVFASVPFLSFSFGFGFILPNRSVRHLVSKVDTVLLAHVFHSSRCEKFGIGHYPSPAQFVLVGEQPFSEGGC